MSISVCIISLDTEKNRRNGWRITMWQIFCWGGDLFVTMDGPNEDLDVAAMDRFIIHTILPLCTGADDSGIEKDF